jgi:hypothetical protein
MHGIGAHEVSSSPDRNATLATLPEKAMEEVLWAYRDTWRTSRRTRGSSTRSSSEREYRGRHAGAHAFPAHRAPHCADPGPERDGGGPASFPPQGTLHLLRHHPAGGPDGDPRHSGNSAFHRPGAVCPPVAFRDLDPS